MENHIKMQLNFYIFWSFYIISFLALFLQIFFILEFVCTYLCSSTYLKKIFGLKLLIHVETWSLPGQKFFTQNFNTISRAFHSFAPSSNYINNILLVSIFWIVPTFWPLPNATCIMPKQLWISPFIHSVTSAILGPQGLLGGL